MTLLWIDTFEDGSQGEAERSADAHSDTTNGSGPVLGGLGDYFFRTNQAVADSGTGLNASFTGFNGNFLWRGEDVEDSSGGTVDPALGFLNWTGIDITGATDISVSGLFGAREFTGSSFTFETTDFITVRFAIDGGGFTEALSFRGTGVTNAQMAQDSNLDGVIDGADNGMLLSQTLASFGFTIAGTGTTLNLQIETNVGSAEEIAFDDIQVDASGPADDFANDTTTTGVVIVDGAAVSGELEVEGDRDYFAIELVAGTQYEFTVDLGSLSDSILTLRSDVGGLLDFNDDFTGLASQLRYFATESGTFFLDVGGFAEVNAGTYMVSASTVAPINGTAGDDLMLMGTNDEDVINGFEGDDIIFGSAGSAGVENPNSTTGDRIDGGEGSDTIDYFASTRGVIIDLNNTTTGQSGALAQGDILISIENVVGTDFIDTITGNND
ncbi:hypothetical protein N9W89_13205, partial [Hellea sp.]|nr:hypothetical protein [Hellea sp.]